MEIQPLRALELNMFCDLNGGWLPPAGSLTRGVLVGDQIRDTSFCVVANIAVPVIPESTWTDFESKVISTNDQTISLNSGDVVPILRGQRKRPRLKQNRKMVYACPRGDGA